MSLKNFMSYDDASTVLGEYADKVNELKSGLTNYEATTNAALAVPENTGKNVLPLTLTNLKSVNTDGTWANNVYTHNGVDFTVNTDSSGNVSGITANGTASGVSEFYLDGNVSKTKYSGCIMSGCVGGSDSTYFIQCIQVSSPWKNQKQTNDAIQLSEFPENIMVTIRIVVSSGVELTDKVFTPMIRPATITDPTFVPYIPSVDARLDTINSKLIKITKERFESITVNAGSKKFVTNVGLLTDNVVVTAYSDVSDVIAYVATATTTYQVYLYNPTNSAITNNVTVMVAKV